jgi:serine protease Do
MEDKKLEKTRSVNTKERAGKPAKQKLSVPAPPVHAWQYAGLILFSFVAAFFGSWLFLATGIVSQNTLDNIAQNRTNIVVQEGELVADIAEEVAPSVVSIAAESRSSASLFGQATQSAGSGIIISKDGYVLTNRHVIAGDTTSIEIVTSDGTVYDDVEVIGSDPLNDLGFLKINGVDNLKPAEIGDSHGVNVGQKVIAIGNALGQYQNTVTSGIISGIGRPVQASDGEGEIELLNNLFQTDAAINPGNSGGPLLNLDGQVIGVNTAIAEEAEGIGFAIPIGAAKGLMKTVTESGKVSRAYLGVQYRSVTPALAKELGISVREGAYLAASDSGSAVVKGSPADTAGLKNNDVITKVNGKTVNERSGLALLLAEYTPGDEVTLTVLRGGDEIEIKVTLGTYR